MPEEEEGDRPVLSFEADESELVSLAAVIGARYEPTLIYAIDAERSIHRLPEVFVRKLAELSDTVSTVRAWQAQCASMRLRDAVSLQTTLAEMREFAVSAINGPGIVVYREDVGR